MRKTLRVWIFAMVVIKNIQIAVSLYKTTVLQKDKIEDLLIKNVTQAIRS